MTVRKGASLEASTASPAAGAIVAALARAGTRLMFGVPGGGPNLDVVGAAEASVSLVVVIGVMKSFSCFRRAENFLKRGVVGADRIAHGVEFCQTSRRWVKRPSVTRLSSAKHMAPFRALNTAKVC